MGNSACLERATDKTAHALLGNELDSGRQRDAVRAGMEEEVVPALDALVLSASRASHAWRARERGGRPEDVPEKR